MMVPAITLSLALTNLVVDNLLSWIPTSLVDCSSRCFHNTSCSSFFYNQGDGTCNLNTVVYSVVSDTLTPSDGVLYYEWKHEDCDDSAGRKFQRASWLCFYLVKSKKDYNLASMYCPLLTANTQSKVDQAHIIASRHDERVWLGGHKIHFMNWRWMSGETFGNFLAWSDGYPVKDKDCMIAVKSTPQWASDTCSKTRWFICEASIPQETSYCNY
ncbi:uncharacterized protein LOC124141500 [Haliotis rufescens]|uniref:uncharacterized protein LOC124141500 n=1 Tax=Haliotis rufescens TaxID=6454 RepID=UPI001EAFBE85|nr:uncharacterized protein LOC124141500 [Haliotis rufescens]